MRRTLINEKSGAEVVRPHPSILSILHLVSMRNRRRKARSLSAEAGHADYRN